MPRRLLLTHATVHTGTATFAGHAVLVEGARIAAVMPAGEAPRADRVLDLEGAHLAPGFVDLQVNGGGGVLFNDDPTPEALARIAAAHRRFGTTGWLPTFISGELAGMRAARDAAHEARRAGGHGVLGIHFEGPFLDPRKPGAHDASALRAPSPEDLEVVTGARADGSRVVVTLAACRYDESTAHRLHAAGVLVSLGHCASTAAEAALAFERGATMVTHLFNAMSPYTSREPGLVGAALDRAASTAHSGGTRVRAGLILDGEHVAPLAARVAVRAATPGGVFLVTDAVSPVGLPPGAAGSTSFELGGQRVRVEAGRCVNDAGALAGSVLDMATAVRNARRWLDVSLDEALRMASTYPAEAIGLGARKGRIAAGYDADLVWLDEDLSVRGTLVAGEAESVPRAVDPHLDDGARR